MSKEKKSERPEGLSTEISYFDVSHIDNPSGKDIRAEMPPREGREDSCGIIADGIALVYCHNKGRDGHISQDRGVIRQSNLTGSKEEILQHLEKRSSRRIGTVSQLYKESKLEAEKQGSTSLEVYIVPTEKSGGTIYMVNTGDSLAVLFTVKNGEAIMQVKNKLHNPTPGSSEEKRVRDKGASIDYDGYMVKTDEDGFVGGLKLTRSIGDFYLESIGLIPDPDIDSLDYSSEEDLYLFVCSDGFYEEYIKKDKAHQEEIANILTKNPNLAVAAVELITLGRTKKYKEQGCKSFDDALGYLIKLEKVKKTIYVGVFDGHAGNAVSQYLQDEAETHCALPDEVKKHVVSKGPSQVTSVVALFSEENYPAFTIDSKQYQLLSDQAMRDGCLVHGEWGSIQRMNNHLGYFNFKFDSTKTKRLTSTSYTVGLLKSQHTTLNTLLKDIANQKHHFPGILWNIHLKIKTTDATTLIKYLEVFHELKYNLYRCSQYSTRTECLGAFRECLKNLRNGANTEFIELLNDIEEQEMGYHFCQVTSNIYEPLYEQAKREGFDSKQKLKNNESGSTEKIDAHLAYYDIEIDLQTKRQCLFGGKYQIPMSLGQYKKLDKLSTYIRDLKYDFKELIALFGPALECKEAREPEKILYKNIRYFLYDLFQKSSDAVSCLEEFLKYVTIAKLSFKKESVSFAFFSKVEETASKIKERYSVTTLALK